MFRDKRFLVVGASSGIGREVAFRLTAEGARVAAWCRRAPEGLEVEHAPVDVLEAISAEVPSPLSGLVYCPGSMTLAPFPRLTVEKFLADLEINLLGAVRVLQKALPALVAGRGSVVLFSTVAAGLGMSYHASIAAAKGAVEGMARSLAAEYAASGVRFNVVAPSLTDTPLAGRLLAGDEQRARAAQRHPLGRTGLPRDIASAALFLLSEESSWMTGQTIGVDGGLSRTRIL